MAGRILVAVKRVVDYNARVRVKPDKVGDGGGRRRRRCTSALVLPLTGVYLAGLPIRRLVWTSTMSRCP